MPDHTRQPNLLPPDAREVLPLDDDGVVIQSVPCLECGYIVRGMTTAQSCPECRTPIARSLRGLLLRFGDLTWLAMIRTGIALVVLFILLNVLIPFDLIEPLFNDDPIIAPALWFGMFFLTGLFVLGQWMLTTTEPTGLLSSREDRLRLVIRVLTVITAALLLLHDAIVTRASLAVEAWVAAATALAMLGTVISTGLFVRRIADRIPDSELRAATTATMIGFAVCLTVYIGTVFWMAASRTTIAELRTVNIVTLILQPHTASNAGAMLWLIAITSAVTTIGAIAVTFGYRSAIREIIQRADYAHVVEK